MRPTLQRKMRANGILRCPPASAGYPRLHNLHTVSRIALGEDLRDSGAANRGHPAGVVHTVK